MKAHPHFTKKLLSYSALSAGFLAIGNNADAQVVYTDIDPDIVLTEDGEWKFIDLDNDGLDDVGLQYTLFTTSSWSVVPGHFNIELIGENQMAIKYGSPCLLYSSLYSLTCYVEMHSVADVLMSGDLIGPANNWGQIDRVRYRFQCGFYGDSCSQNYFNNAWGLPDEQFFAFRFTEPDLNYCWLRLYWDDETLLLTNFACQTLPAVGLFISNPPEIILENETLDADPDYSVTFINNQIIINSPEIIQNAAISVYDVSGRLMVTEKVNEQITKIDFDVHPECTL